MRQCVGLRIKLLTQLAHTVASGKYLAQFAPQSGVNMTFFQQMAPRQTLMRHTAHGRSRRPALCLGGLIPAYSTRKAQFVMQ
ncbi:MAG: hypothetical protein PHO08_13125 [Methylococcales bacterium]|nr:hypothetical protein [Methylococcales bacterium]MDD5630907.1 hypothetical protein [Methylococcales bacterium]